jgi:hypothetical protein
MRILAGVVAVVALSAITAAPAAAVPEFDGEVFPYKLEGKQLNKQGFGDSLAAIASVCETATASTEVEGLANPTKNQPTVTAHPTYGNAVAPTGCTLSLLNGVENGESKINTQGCQYVFHAAAPGTKNGTTDVKCGKQLKVVTAGNCPITTVENASCEVKIEAGAGLPAGCIISVPPQVNLKGVEYKNESSTVVRLNAEVPFEIKTNINTQCLLGKTEAKSGYKEGTVVSGKAKLVEGVPASFETFTAAKTGIEVGINEPHYYENHVGLTAQSGGPGQEGNDVLMWGKLNLASTEIGTSICQVVGAGDIYNPGGGGAFGFGNAAAGASKIDAFHPFDCEEKVGETCETAHAETLSVEPEGLSKGGEWEATLSGPPVHLKIGNKTAKSPTQIQLGVVCGTGANYTGKWTGLLEPEQEPGSSIGSAPAKLQFNTGSLEGARTLPTVGSEEGKVTNNLKMMGFEGGGIVSTKNP